MRTRLTLFALAATALGLVAFSPANSLQEERKPERAPAAQEVAQDDAAREAAIVAAQLPSYPLDVCVISGEPLDAMGSPTNVVVEGRLLRTCCGTCARKAKDQAAALIAKVDAAVIAAQGPSYPLEVCPISGQELGSMGDPHELVHGTRLVRLCCEGCVGGFEKKTKAVMAKIDEALIAAQVETYPLDTCFVSGEPLDANGGPLDFLYGTELVRLCCKGCKRGFDKNPTAMIAKLHEAKQAARAAEAPEEAAEAPPAERGTGS